MIQFEETRKPLESLLTIPVGLLEGEMNVRRSRHGFRVGVGIRSGAGA